MPDSELSVTDLYRLWWVLCAILVFLMQIGFMLVETGLIQERSRSGIALKTFLMLLASSLAYFVIGYPLMFGPDICSGLIGFGFGHSIRSYGLEWLLYQTGFAAIAATIVSGAIAERTTLGSNILVALLIGGIVYPIVGHWVWAPDGWLCKQHFYDYAGAGAVHFLGGIASFAGAIIAGPRLDRYDPDTKSVTDVGGRSLPLASAGVILLWIGWIGFNGGSLHDTSPFPHVGAILIATCCAASAGGLSMLVLSPIFEFSHYFLRQGSGALRHRWIMSWTEIHERGLIRPYDILTATMGGLVAITASSGLLVDHSLMLLPFPSYLFAIPIGMVGGLSAFAVSRLILQKHILRYLQIDDPVDAIAVHAGAGLTGIIAVTWIAGPEHNVSIMVQLKGLLAIGAFTFLSVGLLFFALNGRPNPKKGKAKDVALGVINPYFWKNWFRSTNDDEAFGLRFEQTQAGGSSFLSTPSLSREMNVKLRQYLIDYISPVAHDLASLLDVFSRKAPTNALTEELVKIVRRIDSFIREQAEPTPVNIEEIVNDVWIECRAKYDCLTEASMKLVKAYADAEQQVIPVQGSYYNVRAIVYTLLSNASQAVARRSQREPACVPSLSCKLYDDGAAVSLTVRDNGGGMPSEVAEQILGSPIIRGENANGRGIGLFNAARLTRMLGGTLALWQNGNQSRDTCFRLVLHTFVDKEEVK